MSSPPEEAPKLTKISTLCPTCGKVCTWYRLPRLLYGICPEHGRIEEIEVSTLRPTED